MSDPNAVWYLPGKGEKPAGPLNAEQIIQLCQAGKLPKGTLCWREGMPEWLPLAQVEPFATRIGLAAVGATAQAGVRSGGGHPLRRIIVLPLLVGCLVAAGVVGYGYRREHPAIGQARESLSEGDYDDASRVLRRVADSRFFGQERKYLLAVVEVRQYASEKDDQRSRSDPLRRQKRSLKGVFPADEPWRRQAVSDFADTLADVPSTAPDVVTRSLMIASLLEELEMADLGGHLKKRQGTSRTRLRGPSCTPAAGRPGRRHHHCRGA
jgi:hypothetical protein